MQFTGLITQVITSSIVPEYHVGDSYIGSFTYQSDCIDGTFFCRPTWASNWGPNDLDGFVWAGAGYGAPGTSLDANHYTSFITVAGGVVTDFRWDDQRGPYDPFVGFNTFSFYEGFAGPGFTARGTVEFSPVACVPDYGPTALLLVVSLALCNVYARLRRPL